MKRQPAVVAKPQVAPGRVVVVAPVEAVLFLCGEGGNTGLRAAKASSRRNASEATYRIIPLLDASVILFYAVIQIDIRPMCHLISQSFAYCPWTGTMSICCHRLWRMTNRGLKGTPTRWAEEGCIAKFRFRGRASWLQMPHNNAAFLIGAIISA